MCGIVGCAGKLVLKTDKMFKTLLIVDSLRGIDSTGIAAIDRNDGAVRVVKQVGNPFDLMNLKTFDNAINRFNRAIIGHNRYSTQGAVTKKNAHPFEFENIVGVHNGTLQDRHKLLDHNHFQVDSENLFWHLQEKGLEDLLEVIDGAWSLVWWDKVNETLNFLRNEERPMYIVSSEDDKLIMWASERWMLDVAIQREDIKFRIPLSTSPHQLYSFPIDKDANIDKPHIRPARAKSADRPIVVHQGYHRNFHHGAPTTQTDAPLSVGYNPKSMSMTPTGKVVQFSKKNRVAPLQPKQVAPSSTNLYSGRSNVLLETLAKKTDKRGSDYLVCFDPSNHAASIRLYLKKTDKVATLLKTEIFCTINQKIADGDEGIYYKVDHSSVRLNISKPNDNKESAGNYFMDGSGTLISRADWNQKYHKGCSFCTAPVWPEEPNRFTDTKDIICPDCVADEEIHQYVNIV